MNALFFTYVAIFSFAFLPNLGLNLDFVQTTVASGIFVIIANLWNLYNDKPIIDERKQIIVTQSMAWAYVAVSLAVVTAGTTGIEINLDFLRDISSLGLWTFIMYLSVNMLYQQFGGETE